MKRHFLWDDPNYGFCPKGVGVQLADDLPGTGSQT